MPELTGIRIALDGDVDELAVLFFDLSDIDRESEIAVIVKSDGSTRRLGERDPSDCPDQFVRLGIAAGRLERRFQNLAIDVERRRIKSNRNVGTEVLLHRGDETPVGITIQVERIGNRIYKDWRRHRPAPPRQPASDRFAPSTARNPAY